MNNKRIKYFKDISGNYISHNYLKNKDGIQYRLGFNIGVKTIGFIKSVENDSVHITLEATSPHKIKIKLKKALIKLGCIFENEKRVMIKVRKNAKANN